MLWLISNAGSTAGCCWIIKARELQARFLCQGEGKGPSARLRRQCDPPLKFCAASMTPTARATHPGQLEISFFMAAEGMGGKGGGPHGTPRSSPACRSCSRRGCPLYLLLGDKSPFKREDVSLSI